MNVWHCVIPFYYGENKLVLAKGGAPVSKKLSYLSQTIASIQRLGVNARITVFVCNEPSRHHAVKVHPTVETIDCPPGHLPLETVRTFQSWFRIHGSDDDVVMFNEDDQIVYMTDSVRNDIEHATQEVVFSPHRWSRQFLYFRRKGRPVHYLVGRRGVLDNMEKEPGGREFRLNHRYKVQSSRHAAYAACWFMKGSLFKTLNLRVPAESVELESASYVVFENGIPVLKLRTDDNQPLSAFMVDHLSGYDYNKRLIR
jgi:hypothetical protein